MADNADEGALEEGTYPRSNGGKQHNGGIVQEMCTSAMTKRHGESKKGGKKMYSAPKGGMSYGEANQ